MKKIVLFSAPTEKNIKKISALLLPEEIKNKVFAFMPSDGVINCKQKYIDLWKEIAQKSNTDFVLIDNLTNNPREEIEKVKNSNVLVISGGNTFKLLDNLRKSGLDKAVCDFASKDNFVLGGYSAGALILTPSIEICNLPNYDENIIGITNLTGLGIVDFELFPHYTQDYEEIIQNYEKNSKLQVKTITDDDFIELNIS